MYYVEGGTVTRHPIIIRKHILLEIYTTMDGKTKKNTRGITKTIQECLSKYYYPGLLARSIRAWVTSCSDSIVNERIDTRQIRPKMLSNKEFTMGPEE